jgi:NCS1 family nucleobase:cation symporter-1
VGGIMIADYFLIRNKRLRVDDLYNHQGIYRYRNGFNTIAIGAFLAGVLPNVPGFLLQVKLVSGGLFPEWINGLYHYAWFVGFFVSGLIYWLALRKRAVI